MSNETARTIVIVAGIICITIIAIAPMLVGR